MTQAAAEVREGSTGAPVSPSCLKKIVSGSIVFASLRDTPLFFSVYMLPEGVSIKDLGMSQKP
jgi:hypothetical protein